ncbi:PIG-F-domain-containing protein [Calocera cornea HHB12733]|uniref:PIG-F-domain-containing protein n=1 Tax=Calocera cornea HHB12733 TaxID=1353952 RepID=A0A165EJC3_9BASI|nr:PIG-F-domain-containing protein [Calocera cornea HHB12733]
MAKNKASSSTAAVAAKPAAQASSPFPLARYASVLGPHTLLLAFSSLYLPRTSELFFALPPPKSSLDHPQPKWMEPITAAPVWTLLWVTLGVWGCVGAWAGSVRRWAKAAGVAGRGSDWIALRNAVLSLALFTPVFFVLVVLLGAPFSSYLAHTLLLSVLLSLLTAYVPAYVLPPPRQDSSTSSLVMRLQWTRLFSEFLTKSPLERILVYPALGTLIGAWAGAAPIALDWDRPWQAWPLTPAYGAIIGYIAGSYAALMMSGMLHFAAQDTGVKKTQ